MSIVATLKPTKLEIDPLNAFDHLISDYLIASAKCRRWDAEDKEF